MAEKRFIDGGEESIEDQFLIDTKTDTNYWIDNGLDDIIKLLNELGKENEQLKSELVKIKRQEQEVIEYLRAYHKGDVKELKE